MFEKVLILTDFSEYSRRLLDCITGIQGISEIVLLHVIEDFRSPLGADTVEEFVKSAAEKSFQVEKRYLETLSPNISVTPELIISSDTAGTILKTAEKNGVDLIIIGAYGIGMKTGLLTGDVESAILCRISRINVLVMRHRILETMTGKTYEKFCPMIFSRILCPTNFSPDSEQAIALASTMKGVGEIILLHVISPGDAEIEAPESALTVEMRIGAIRDTLATKGIRSRVIVTTGNPASEISGTAEKEDVSVIWINSYGKGCFHDFLLGSRVNDVVMSTRRPVIIIRGLD